MVNAGAVSEGCSKVDDPTSGVLQTQGGDRLTLVLYNGDIFLEPRLFEVRLLEILKNSGFKLFHERRIFEVLEKNRLCVIKVPNNTAFQRHPRLKPALPGACALVEGSARDPQPPIAIAPTGAKPRRSVVAGRP